MKSQWDCLLQNLGKWQGSFTRLSPSGAIVGDTATIVSLEGLNNNQTIRQSIQRSSEPGNDTVLEYSSLGRGVLFLETGAFSQGSMQFGPFSEFGAELGLIETNEDNVPGDRRLRLVQLYSRESQLHQLTLIREQRAGSTAKERSPLTVAALLGTWQGEATTVYPDWRNPETYSTTLHVCQDSETRLTQELTMGTQQVIRSTAEIDGSILRFNHGTSTIQVLLLPDGASSTCPIQIKAGQPFFLEVGWLLQPDLRQRLIRSYSDRGEWSSLTLVIERKQTT